MEAGSAPSDAGYDGAAVAGAVLMTLFFPFIALIAALLLQGGQQDPRKKSQLRTWAWASGGVMVLDLVLVLLAVGVFAGHGS
jgi:fumarate reductase subunit D